jgi:FtsZ-binding cell division protein ZapB
MFSSVKERRERARAGENWTPKDALDQKAHPTGETEEFPTYAVETLPLWQLDIAELTGHNLEARGREEVNRLLSAGWLLLHIYTLKHREDEVWRERPMAVLGRPRHAVGKIGGAHEPSSADYVSEHPIVEDR